MSVTLSLFAGAGAQFLDNSGNVLSGGLIYTYNAGTTTPLATYTSNLGDTPQSNPIVLNASGRIPTGELWLSNGFGYKFVVKDANNVLIGTYDNVPSSAQPPIVNDASSIAYELGTTVIAGSFVIGQTYLITSIGSTNFQAIGASANQVGVYFTATGIGSGSGTAQISRTVQSALQSLPSLADFDNYSNFNSYANSLTNPVNFAIKPENTIRTLISKIQDFVSVLDFGADNTGITDATTAFENAIAALPVGGGTIYIPKGIYAINLVINTDGVTFVGPGMTRMSSVPLSNYVKPYNITKPVIQIGNDSRLVTGTCISNLTIYGANVGSIGLYLYAGAMRCQFNNIGVFNFANSCVQLQDGTNYPVVFNNFSNISLQSSVSGVNVLSIQGAGSQYVSANHFVNMDVSGPSSSGYALNIKNTGVNITNAWLEVQTNCGIYIDTNGRLYGENVNVDSNNSADILVTFFPTINSVADYIFGDITFDGNMKNGDGTTIYTQGYSFWNPNACLNVYPIVQGTIQFCENYSYGANTIDLSIPKSKIYAGNTNLYLDNPNGNIVVNSSSGTVFRPNVDNNQYLGSAGQRWIAVFAVNGAIQTSDANEKTDIVDISDVEKRVAVKLKSSMKRFKFKTGDRYHFGTIAQSVKMAFESEGLVAEEYGIFCSDTWYEVDGKFEDEQEKAYTIDSPNAVAKTRLGVRYDELFAFIISTL